MIIERDAEDLGLALPLEGPITALKNRQTDGWAWAPEIKEIALKLVDLIPVED